MFKNINNLLIWCIGLIICYIFYNVFILEKFAEISQPLSEAQKVVDEKKKVADEKKKLQMKKKKFLTK